MSVLYDNKKLIPLSTAGFTKNIVKSGEDEHINYTYNIRLEGHLLPFKGSPDSTGAFWINTGYPPDETPVNDKELTNLVAKQTAISDLFSVEGKTLEFQPWDGGPNIKCNPRVVSIDWPDGLWFNEIPYTVNLEAPHIFYEGNLGSGYLDVPTIRDYNVSQISETWNVELNEEEEFWTIKRDLSAKGDRVFTENGALANEPWHEARRWCVAQSTSGVLPDFAKNSDPMVSGLAGFIGYNYSRISSADKKGGAYSLSETWVATSGSRPYIESFEVTYSRNNEDGLDNVAINGEIRGLDFTTRIPFPASGKLEQANLAFSGIWSTSWGYDTTFQRAKQHSEIIDLNPVPRSESVARREKVGVISYQREYDNRPLNMISGALIERVEVSDDFPHGIYPVITIPGRPAALIQNIGANTMGKRTVTVTIVMDRKKEPYASLIGSGNYSANYYRLPRPNVSGILNLFTPPGDFSYNYVSQENPEQWNPQSLKLTKSLTWLANSLPGYGT